VAPRDGEVARVLGPVPALDEIDEAVFGGPDGAIGEALKITADRPAPVHGEEAAVIDDGLSWLGLTEPAQKLHLAHEDARRLPHGRTQRGAAGAVGNAEPAPAGSRNCAAS